MQEHIYFSYMGYQYSFATAISSSEHTGSPKDQVSVACSHSSAVLPLTDRHPATNPL
jgi:hypothetical protein